MENWFNDMAGWATGDEEIGDRLGEAAMHGLTRLVGVSTSNSLGADNSAYLRPAEEHGPRKASTPG